MPSIAGAGGRGGGGRDKKWNVPIRAHPLSGNFKLAPGHYYAKVFKLKWTQPTSREIGV